MAAAVLDETMIHGTTHKFRLSIINERTQAAVDITSWLAFWCTVKAAKTDADASAALSLSLATTGIAVIDFATGLIEITIPDTAFASAIGVTTPYYLDVKGKDSTGQHWGLGMGRLTVQGEVTRAA